MVAKGVYKDAFILHDQSKDDPHYVKVRKRFPDVYEAIVGFVLFGSCVSIVYSLSFVSTTLFWAT